jgi:phosphoribosylamine--glycine ligase
VPTRVLVVGGGGREHALARRLAVSAGAPTLHVVPGNPGTARLGRNVEVDPQDEDRLARFCHDERIDLVVVGPEDPLIAGLADRLRAEKIAVFGPGAAGARLEGDKAYAKQLMGEAGVPTAGYAAFDDVATAHAHLESIAYPVVVKACGAAQGKGVAVCPDRAAAQAHVDLCLREHRFGAAGSRILIEECLVGKELSVLAVTDGRSHVLLVPARDHKRIGEGDTGPNTGGMGAFAPVALDGVTAGRIETEIFRPMLSVLRQREIPYRGVLYAGLMLTDHGPQVLEFNCRFGDPETQVVLPLLRTDLLGLLAACAHGRLAAWLAGQAAGRPSGGPAGAPGDWPGGALSDWSRHAVVVVAAARGYPGSYVRDIPLSLPEDEPEAWLVHAGTTRRGQQLVSSGGRVLGAVGLGDSRSGARRRAYGLLHRVQGEGLVHRRDIAGPIEGEAGE